MEPAERLERLDRAIEELAVASAFAPIVVEGQRDEAALRALGIEGEIFVYNRGGTMADVAELLRPRTLIVVLFDWDRKGGALTQRLKELLGGTTKLNLDLRRELATVSLVRCVEDLPAARRALQRRLDPRAGE